MCPINIYLLVKHFNQFFAYSFLITFNYKLITNPSLIRLIS